MPFSFPSSPTNGQTSVQNGRTYQWNGKTWDLVSNVGGHAATHASGGTDAISISATQVTSGTLSDDRLSDAAQVSSDLYLWSNFR